MTGLELLGFTLLHFLWQGFLIAALYAAGRRCASRPEVRYLIACAALAAMAMSPVVTWITLRPASSKGMTLSFTESTASAATGLRGNLDAFFAAGYEPGPLPWLSWVATAWMVGVVVCCLRLLVGLTIAERLRRRQVSPAPSEWQQVFDEFRVRLTLSRPVRLLVSGLADAPTVVGVLRPVVLVPAGVLTGLPPEQMEALLLHELAHIRRYDHVVNALQSIVEALLFYHPAVWWVSDHMRSEREMCCDDATVAITGDAQSYARALAEVAIARQAHYRVAVAATGGSLSNRIARLLGQQRPASRTHSAAALAAALLSALIAVTTLGQTARPQFEVASIRPVSSPVPPTMRLLPGRITANAPLRTLVQSAYRLQPSQLVGGPEWIGSEPYEVDAKAAGNADQPQMLLMLQSLLEDRFRLRVHRESREMPVYALVASRSGLKLSSPQAKSCLEDTEVLGPLVDPSVRIGPPGQDVAPTTRCGNLNLSLEPGGARLRGGKVSMAVFASVISGVVGQTVKDQTGFSGVFDVTLDFLPDEATRGLPPPPPGTLFPGTVSPSIFNAVQQLGLQLQSTRGPVDVLVIDRVERPLPN